MKTIIALVGPTYPVDRRQPLTLTPDEAVWLARLSSPRRNVADGLKRLGIGPDAITR